MSWVIVLANDSAHVEFSRFAHGAKLATVDGVREWESRRGADEALKTYRARVVWEAAAAAGQREIDFGGEA